MVGLERAWALYEVPKDVPFCWVMDVLADHRGYSIPANQYALFYQPGYGWCETISYIPFVILGPQSILIGELEVEM